MAVISPTTILTQQHFETFKNRLSAFPVSIEYLSRLNERYEAWIHNYNKGELLIVDIDDLDFVENKDDLKKIISLIDKKMK